MPSVDAIDLTVFAELGDAPARDLALLGPDNPTARRCEIGLFGRADGGRVAALVNPRLVDDEHRPVGQLGFFRCADDPAAAAALLDAGCEWLRGRGCRVVRGPMHLSTWHDYRFVTAGHSAGAIPGEPDHPPYYPALWRAAGFAACATYSTNWLGDGRDVVAKFDAAARRSLDAGYSVRGITADDLPALYKLSSAAFADAFSYSPIEADEFAALYSADQARAVARSSYIAHSPTGEPVGFLYAFPMTLGGREASVCKTVAVAPAVRGRGVYPLLMRTWVGDGIADGFDHFVGALMHVDGSPANMGWTRPEMRIKEYALYERRL